MDLLTDLYTDFLIACPGQTTCTLLSEVLDNNVSHDRFTRLLGSGKIDSGLLWREAKPMCREIASDDAVLIIDDSVEAKPHSRCNGLVRYHFDHTQGKSVKGVNFISAIYHSWEMSLPIGVDFVVKEEAYTGKDGKTRYRAKVGKNEMFRRLVGRAASQLPFRYVLADSWFASAGNMEYIDDMDGHFIMAMKENRRVALGKEDKQAGRYVSITAALAEGGVRSVYVEQLGFPILIAKQVFKNGDGSTGTLYLSSNDLGLTYEQITTIYKKRWKVEEYHKSIKSNTAFPRSPTSSMVAQRSHFVASILANLKLERLKVRHKKNHSALKSLLMKNATISAWKKLNTLNMAQTSNVYKAA
jgi:hypothetical protein